MPDTPEKRRREAQKRRNREEKAKRKQLRKDGVLGQDTSGLFAPGEVNREVMPIAAPPPPPPQADDASNAPENLPFKKP
jgi:hypothetical protein